MTRKTNTLPPAYFEEKYRCDIDPWQFRTSEYEAEKYGATMRSLTEPFYERALEIGCSIGVLSSLLSVRCTSLVAIDASETAIREAKRLTLANVDFARARFKLLAPRLQAFQERAL